MWKDIQIMYADDPTGVMLAGLGLLLIVIGVIVLIRLNNKK